jgi:hypothetical protein
MTATIVVGGETFTVDLGDKGKMTVYGLTVGNRTTSLDISGGTLYVWQNSDYPSTYLTSYTDNLTANTSMNYYNLFTVEGQNIVSVARDQALNNYSGTISFAPTGTNYNIAKFGNSSINVSYKYTYPWGSTTTYYLRQSNETTVQGSTTNSSRNWNVYTVDYDRP